jgi:hypothetical protein
MTLLITASPPLIEITDADGHVVLNLTEQLFSETDYITGSLTTPTRDTGTDIVVDYSIGSCHAAATFVRGAMRITSFGSTGLGFSTPPTAKWFNVSGTWVYAQHVSLISQFTFKVASGVVTLREASRSKLQQNAAGQTYQIAGITIDYKLIVGYFG